METLYILVLLSVVLVFIIGKCSGVRWKGASSRISKVLRTIS
jgi:hypothetical protein